MIKLLWILFLVLASCTTTHVRVDKAQSVTVSADKNISPSVDGNTVTPLAP